MKGNRIVHITNTNGHRREYLELFASTLGLRPSIGKVRLHNIKELISAESLFFGTIDDDYLGFFFIAFCRTVQKRRTVGLLLRPQTAFSSSGFKYRFKRLMFAFLKRIAPVSVFTIIPFSVAPKYAAIADGGVMDPQMWDKADHAIENVDTALLSKIRSAAAGRKVLAFIGTVTEIKGIEFLRDLMASADWPASELFVVVAGRFPKTMIEVEAALKKRGAMIVPRFISDSELEALYEGADLVWACYRPDYDQASGVFGRALQWNKTPIVRANSLVARIAHEFGVPVIEVEFGALEDGSRRLSAVALLDGAETDTLIETWKRDFLEQIRRAL